MLRTSEHKKKLREALDRQRSQNTLNLNDFVIGDDGCSEVAKFLQENNNFEIIEIKGNNISGKGFAAICLALANSPSLKRLSAEWNIIGSDRQGLEALKRLLFTCRTLTSVDLRNNKINFDGAKIISDIISNNETLQELDLRWNEFGILGGQAIMEALQTNNSLMQLDIKCNKLTQDIVQVVDDLLARNHRALNERKARERERERMEAASKESKKPISQGNEQETRGRSASEVKKKLELNVNRINFYLFFLLSS